MLLMRAGDDLIGIGVEANVGGVAEADVWTNRFRRRRRDPDVGEI